eukprot:GEMP01085881.1.p1 GENE.GEMP01085881.1~~GEMP01085881.1.p1  ORF type:complete len:316 (+),score=46.17 GEMP01085881.1:33-980(+)
MQGLTPCCRMRTRRPLPDVLGGQQFEQRDRVIASDAMRMAVFDRVEEPSASTKHPAGHKRHPAGHKRHPARSMGTEAEITTLWKAWQSMDMDESGSISAVKVGKWLRRVANEKDDYFKRRRVQLGEKCIVDYLAESRGGDYNAELHIDCFVKIIWPDAEPSHIHAIKCAVHRLEARRGGVHTPQVMDEELRAELVENFRSMDTGKVGFICVEDLERIGLHRDEVRLMMETFGITNPNEGLTLHEYITMMCPIDILPHPNSKRCRTTDGLMVYDETPYYTGWRLSETLLKVIRRLEIESPIFLRRRDVCVFHIIHV